MSNKRPFGTAPNQAPLNWMLGALAYLGREDIACGYFKVSDQKASGTVAGASVAATISQTRTLNTVEKNTINGASLASNTITLPAGTYSYRIRAPGFGCDGHKAFLYNSADSAYVGIGSDAFSSTGVSPDDTSSDSVVSGQFTITASKTFTVRHYTQTALSSNGLGKAVNSGQVSVFTEAEFWKEY